MYLPPSLAYAYALARYGGVSKHGMVLNAIAKDDKGRLLWLDRALAFCFATILVITANIRVGAALMMAISLRD